MKGLLQCYAQKGGWALPKDAGSCRKSEIEPELASRDQIQDEVFNKEELTKIRAAVRTKYREVSQTAMGRFRYPTGREGALHLGYDKPYLDQIPEELLASFCGVGNPFLIEPIRSGSAVLDVGCGAGLDLLVAARTVGLTGRVCGVDLSEEMLVKARENVRRSGCNNVEVVQVDNEVIPLRKKFFDVVISNGVINLSPRKLQLYREIRRVLKPGGRLQFADIVLERRPPSEVTGTLEAWSQWIGGAVSVRDQLELMSIAGFSQVACVGKTDIKTSEFTAGALFRAMNA